ncbi:unnamed protein product, partial [Tuber aestivum]
MRPLNLFHSTFVAKSLTAHVFELIFMTVLIRADSSENLWPHPAERSSHPTKTKGGRVRIPGVKGEASGYC